MSVPDASADAFARPDVGVDAAPRLDAEAPSDAAGLPPRFESIAAGPCVVDDATDPASEIRIGLRPCREGVCEELLLRDAAGLSLRVIRVEGRGEGQVPLLLTALDELAELLYVVVLDVTSGSTPAVRAVARIPSRHGEPCGFSAPGAGPEGAAFMMTEVEGGSGHLFHYRAGDRRFGPSVAEAQLLPGHRIELQSVGRDRVIATAGSRGVRVWTPEGGADRPWAEREHELEGPLRHIRFRPDGALDAWISSRGLVRLSWPALEVEATYFESRETPSWAAAGDLIAWAARVSGDPERRYAFASGRLCGETLCDLAPLEAPLPSRYRGHPRARGGVVLLGDYSFSDAYLLRVRDGASRVLDTVPEGRFSPPVLTDRFAYTVHDADERTWDRNERFLRFPYPDGFAPGSE